MRTVPTLLATGAGIPLAVARLKLALDDDSRFPASTEREPGMTAVATYTLSTLDRPPSDFDLPTSRAFSSPVPPRTAGELEDGRRIPLSNTRPGSKSRSLTPRADDTRRYLDSRPPAWLRRWSSSMSVSRDSNTTPTSRPSSAAISQSNASGTLSYSDSNAPIFPDSTPPSLPRNKLVKRTSSTHDSGSARKPGSASRLPLPVLQRPATSHQRSLTLQDLYKDNVEDQDLVSRQSQHARDTHWRHYFVPRAGFEELIPNRRRNSTGIPNPIKRIYPQRKHLPVMVSAGELVSQAPLEMDDDADDDSYWSEDDMGATLDETTPSSLPFRAGSGSPANTPLSFSSSLPGISTPLWKRPASSRGKNTSNKLIKGTRPRIFSAPHESMGTHLSITSESERPAKRRDTADTDGTRRKTHSSSSGSHDLDVQVPFHNQLDHAPGPKSMHVAAAHSPLNGIPPDAGRSLLIGGRRSSLDINDAANTRPGRVSATQSELTSTTGSDSEHQSVGGYSTDNQSDTVFDTIPTQRSNSGKRGPPIDTIFDESPVPFSSGRSTRLRDFLSDGNFPGNDRHASHRHSTIEEEESVISTPVRSIRDKSVGFSPSFRAGTQYDLASSPPATAIIADADQDDIDWEMPDPGVDGTSAGRGLGSDLDNPFTSTPLLVATKTSPFQFGVLSRSINTASSTSTPQRNGSGTTERANLFDWSEQLPSPSHQNSPPRPRTVHGKKDPENRGSRAAGRRPPSGMHARSHSVPLVPDVDGKRPNVIANKFGTWGVGTKAVTEDWNEDFDFDESLTLLPELSTPSSKRIDSAMFVPKSIREQQENVVANIGLLREWGLLIEELKDLRIRAFALDMINGDGPFAKAWQEVDAMIDLADQETEEETLEPRRSPPSSPGFDYNAFEEPLGIRQGEDDTTSRPRANVGGAGVNYPEDNIRQTSHHGSPRGTIPNRPRKDSEAVARSVIEALQARRGWSQEVTGSSDSTSKKLPFDTATLRHIVPYVNGLKRKVKDGLREKEGLYSSPRRPLPSDEDDDEMRDDDDGTEPAFRSIFNDPGVGGPSSEPHMRCETALPDNDNFAENSANEQTGDLANRIQSMTLPR